MSILLQNPKFRWQLFSELAQLSRAGVPLTRASKLFAERKSGDLRHFGDSLQAGLTKGWSIPEAMAANLNGMELSIISAADASGQLPQGFKHLEKYYELLMSTRRQIIAGITYPLFVLHLAAVVYAIVKMAYEQKDFLPSLLNALFVLWIFLFAVVAVLAALNRLAEKSVLVDSILRMVPGSGGARKAMALSRWCLATHFQVLAGRNLASAFESGGEASQSAVIQGFSKKLCESTKLGNPVSPLFLNSSAIPHAFASSMATAEEAGNLDVELGNWVVRFQEDAHHAMANFAAWLPRVIFMGVAGLVVWIIYKATTSQMDMYARVLDGSL